MIAMRGTVREGTLQDDLTATGDSGVGLWWLGQAGFILSCKGVRVVIDPYLSDSLAIKYRGQEFPHQRMMPPPVEPEELRGVDWVFCTHAHSDHMDPGTLPVLAKNNRDCRFLVPRAEAANAVARGVPNERLVLIDGHERMELGGGLSVEALPAAHEELERDDQGCFRFLGYCLRMGGVIFYHSGDCVPYAGLAYRLAQMGPDVALLPVNGRDEYRRSRRVPGNFTIAEAIALCKQSAVPVLFAHHWGMFDFNTVSKEELESANAQAGTVLRMIIPDARMRYEFHPEVHKPLISLKI